jgi:hypothetical protein
MRELIKRMEKLEETMLTHLIESGEIRSDLKWLKRAFWTIAGTGFTFATVMIGYLFNHVLNK